MGAVLVVIQRMLTEVQPGQMFRRLKLMAGCWPWPILNISREVKLGARRSRGLAASPWGQELMRVLTDSE